MKCLVTGGEGFIGTNLVKALIDRGDTVTVIDDRSAPENEAFYRCNGASYYNFSILDDKTAELYSEVDVVFHLAARSRIQPSFSNPEHTFVNNVIGTQSVLEKSTRAGVKRVVYSGSSSCYGRRNDIPFKESMKPDCLNAYALSKKQGEDLCALYTRMHGLETVVLRYFNVYGPLEPLKGQYAPVIGIFKKQAREGNRLTIVGDGSQRRDFTHVKDVVSANILSATASSVSLTDDGLTHTVFNVGTGKSYSINDIARLVLKTDKLTDSDVIYQPARRGEATVTLADNRKIRERLGWSPTVKIEEVIHDYESGAFPW